jgi:hypothetical protein
VETWHTLNVDTPILRDTTGEVLGEQAMAVVWVWGADTYGAFPASFLFTLGLIVSYVTGNTSRIPTSVALFSVICKHLGHGRSIAGGVGIKGA